MPTMPKAYRERLKSNVYRAHLRGMTVTELTKVYQIGTPMVKTLLQEAEEESVKNRSKQEEDVARAIMIDQINEAIATCYTRVSYLEDVDPNTGKPSMSPGNNNAFAGLMNNVRAYLELRAKVEGLMIQRIAGADGKGPVEIAAITDKDAAIKEIMGKLEQHNKLKNSRLLPVETVDAESHSYTE